MTVFYPDFDTLIYQNSARGITGTAPPTQEVFVKSSLARQLVKIKDNGSRSGKLLMGNTSIARDFTNVRDVAAAYEFLRKKGSTGKIYNEKSKGMLTGKSGYR